jgi:hypothetical protein
METGRTPRQCDADGTVPCGEYARHSPRHLPRGGVDSETRQENYKQQTSDNYETEKPFTHNPVSSHYREKILKKDS